ncbi:regulatory protein MsrR [Peptoclostridium acidaminophilum DSM 3953]|uniref:Regulatory protein MsrR n=2 Tax=Peptoclostridium acidaminophilum TaxID=1731 RepID=W8T949_PEPAC|nr:regulatory protein MsrR [Peptoclostridium acidaminophilum DSM 3953]
MPGIYAMDKVEGNKGKRKFIPALVAAAILVIAAIFVLQWKPLEESRAIQKPEFTKEEKIMAKENRGIQLPAQNDKTVNILLLGIDDRGMDFKGRTDSIMVVTLDFKNKTTRLTSIMRDSYVDILGKGYSKINEAYSYGGPELLVRTLKYNFNIDLEHYALIDFYGFQKVVDLLGGISVEVKPYEVDELNNYIKQGPQNYLSGPGMYNLNGDQTLAYTSIRFVGNGDYERTERQRRVISLIIDKAKSLGLKDGAEMAKQIYPYLRSDISIGDMLAYGYSYSSRGRKA